ncbi:MAG: BamA/TamA family outer membrane protein [Gammaproteobacteria bacterium]
MPPHFLSPRTRAGLRLTQAQEDEETYLLDISRFQSRLEHRFTPAVTGFAGLGIAYARLDEVAQATTAALGDVWEKGFLFGSSAGVSWDTTDDPFAPKAGGVVSLLAEQAAGDFSFFKLTSEAKGYRSVGWETVLAGRLKIGILSGAEVEGAIALAADRIAVDVGRFKYTRRVASSPGAQDGGNAVLPTTGG